MRVFQRYKSHPRPHPSTPLRVNLQVEVFVHVMRALARNTSHAGRNLKSVNMRKALLLQRQKKHATIAAATIARSARMLDHSDSCLRSLTLTLRRPDISSRQAGGERVAVLALFGVHWLHLQQPHLTQLSSLLTATHSLRQARPPPPPPLHSPLLLRSVSLCRSSPCNLTHSISQQATSAASCFQHHTLPSPVTPFVQQSSSQLCSPSERCYRLSTAASRDATRSHHGSTQQHRHSAALQHLSQETQLQRYQSFTHPCSKQAASQQLLQVEGPCCYRSGCPARCRRL